MVVEWQERSLDRVPVLDVGPDDGLVDVEPSGPAGGMFAVRRDGGGERFRI
ncbi:hypothetical protein AB0F93_00330 [Micromonospora tulbaghiae]|uniref:hypothetical protein n=1 Tax=Micromonospora tulbaghiae TaxID=479978 RepID=UPI00332C55FE